ncbi:hypothetical protein TSUD_80370 [Trifolium subterraneum]|uniref:Uncharacterized protein n=1 Tax=Trifolium subterraneum TaxID=3900 RepID=A0A2Z6M8Y5_TRISU|nr:hypothetical protein TSUD_80370 [Trifolium subterraneum]
MVGRGPPPCHHSTTLGVALLSYIVDLHHVAIVEVVFKRCCSSCWCCLISNKVLPRSGLAVGACCYAVVWFVPPSRNTLSICCGV